jgi:tetrahydromethanopterin S-methyltransferase subunit G
VEQRQLAESVEQLEEKVQKRAYELYELRARKDGRDLDDWLKAESQVTGKG